MAELSVSLPTAFEDGPVYHQWLPIGPDDAIIVKDGDLTIQISHSLRSCRFARTVEEIQKTSNVQASLLHVEATCVISAELGEYIRNHQVREPSLQSEYEALGRRIQAAVVKRLNRLANFLAAMREQYTIDLFHPDEINPSQFFRDATATVDGVNVQFDPQRRVIVLRGHAGKKASWVTQSQWPAVQAFVAGDLSIPLPRSLIANAYRLASQGLRKNALVDAVTALEVALAEFAQNAQVARINHFQDRMEPTTLKGLIQTAGLRGSFALVLPVLLSEEEIAADVLRDCRKAIDRRNNIVHNGARDVQESELGELLAAARTACRALEKLTNPAVGSGEAKDPQPPS